MAVLEPGTFKTSDYRKAIPDWVKVTAAVTLVLNMQSKGRQLAMTPTEFARSLQYDHRPALNARPYDTAAGDFMPPQNDPVYIDAILKADHLYRTTGRKPGAEKTVTTRGSDVGEAAHARKVSESQALHEARLAEKKGDRKAANVALSRVRRSRLRPKPKIQSRGFQKVHRPMRQGGKVAPSQKKRAA